jgi:pimeloyl-ACP methyl ester carboxylesterase
VGGLDGNDPLDYNPDLDMYNPKNGPPFQADFRKSYHAAQIERNHKITRWCQSVVERIKTLGNPSMSDLTFIVHRADANLAFLDKADDSSGLTIWAEDPRVSNYTPGPLRGPNTRLRAMTVKSWLSQRGLLSSQFDLFKFLPNCHIPTLVICGTADEGGTDQSQAMFDAAPDPGKQLVWVKDLTHFMRGQEDKQAEVADAIANFARTRGLMKARALT